MSDEKKYSADEAAKMVLKKAYEMVNDHKNKLEKCGDITAGDSPAQEGNGGLVSDDNSDESMEKKQDGFTSKQKTDVKAKLRAMPTADKAYEDKKQKEYEDSFTKNDKLKKFMAKKEEKRIKDGTTEQLKEIVEEKDYKGNQ